MPPDRNTDDDDAVPELIPRRETQPQFRALTPTDAKTIAEATTAGQLAAQREGNLRSLELHFAEWFGADGDGGRLAAMEKSLAEHETAIASHGGQLAQLAEFKGRLVWLGGLAVTIGGILAAIGFKVVDHFLK